MDTLSALLAAIPQPDVAGMARAQQHIDGLLKPPGSLGRLESLAVQLAGLPGLQGPVSYTHLDVKATLTFGSYHDVDSSEMAFRMAAIFGFREGARKADPVILEPVMHVEVETPEEYAGNIMGDLSSRRGMVQGMEERFGSQIIRADVPLAEMFGYSTTLRSMSQGRATYSMEFHHYAEAPRNVADEIIASRAKS